MAMFRATAMVLGLAATLGVADAAPSQVEMAGQSAEKTDRLKVLDHTPATRDGMLVMRVSQELADAQFLDILAHPAVFALHADKCDVLKPGQIADARRAGLVVTTHCEASAPLGITQLDTSSVASIAEEPAGSLEQNAGSAWCTTLKQVLTNPDSPGPVMITGTLPDRSCDLSYRAVLDTLADNPNMRARLKIARNRHIESGFPKNLSIR